MSCLPLTCVPLSSPVSPPIAQVNNKQLYQVPPFLLPGQQADDGTESDTDGEDDTTQGEKRSVTVKSPQKRFVTERSPETLCYGTVPRNAL